MIRKYQPIAEPVEAVRVPDKGGSLAEFFGDVASHGATDVRLTTSSVFVKFGGGVRGRSCPFGSWLVFGSDGPRNMSDEDFRAAYRVDDIVLDSGYVEMGPDVPRTADGLDLGPAPATYTEVAKRGQRARKEADTTA